MKSHRRVCPVDDWWKREDSTLGIIEHWVDNRVLDDGDKLLEFLIMIQVVLGGKRSTKDEGRAMINIKAKICTVCAK